MLTESQLFIQEVQNSLVSCFAIATALQSALALSPGACVEERDGDTLIQRRMRFVKKLSNVDNVLLYRHLRARQFAGVLQFLYIPDEWSCFNLL
jgi:hypothetical protein